MSDNFHPSLNCMFSFPQPVFRERKDILYPMNIITERINNSLHQGVVYWTDNMKKFASSNEEEAHIMLLPIDSKSIVGKKIKSNSEVFLHTNIMLAYSNDGKLTDHPHRGNCTWIISSKSGKTYIEDSDIVTFHCKDNKTLCIVNDHNTGVASLRLVVDKYYTDGCPYISNEHRIHILN